MHICFDLDSIFLINNKINFIFILCSPKSDIIRPVFFCKIFEDEILKKRSLIESLIETFKIVDKIISESRIIKIYFWHFRELFPYIRKKRLNGHYMIRFPHNINVIFNCRYREIYSIRDFMKIKKIPYLICKYLEEEKILFLILYFCFKNIFFNITQSKFLEVFFLFLKRWSKNYIGIASIYHKFMIQ